MAKIALSEILGYTIRLKGGSTKTIISVDPLNETCGWDGYDAEWHDPVMGILTFDQLLGYGLEVVLTDEEQAKVDMLRLTRQVEEKAKALGDVLSKWLTNDKAR